VIYITEAYGYVLGGGALLVAWLSFVCPDKLKPDGFFLAGDSPPHPSGRPVRLIFNPFYFIELPGSNTRPWVTNLSSTSCAFRSWKIKMISALLTPKLVSVRFGCFYWGEAKISELKPKPRIVDNHLSRKNIPHVCLTGLGLQSAPLLFHAIL